MGGSSKKQTVGYRYSLGAHLALCHGPVDAIREIRVDDRIAWSIGIGAARSTEGTGVGAAARLGTVAGMSAIAGSGEEDSVAGSASRVRLPGSGSASSYDLALGTDGTTRTVTVQRGEPMTATNGLTTWRVEPAAARLRRPIRHGDRTRRVREPTRLRRRRRAHPDRQARALRRREARGRHRRRHRRADGRARPGPERLPRRPCRGRCARPIAGSARWCCGRSISA